MLLRPLESIRKQASALAAKLRKAGLPCEIQVVDGFSQTGSGSFPDQNLPTKLVSIDTQAMSSVILANRLRHYTVPVFARIQDDKVHIDPRTLLDGDDKIILEALGEIIGS
jgi:L-seryl-tRNA(Ser) seleniumtransferase